MPHEAALEDGVFPFKTLAVMYLNRTTRSPISAKQG